ncbi:MAG: lipopolysaccharide transport system ATP-binding protein [Solirubrobacteraceae bacterium]|jgi:lipopolysaccharide transport system ATP-binding protein|nr:lipopolysaccharide transport system ATP-binding protein [Solirubrobacteraceae bacterium]
MTKDYHLGEELTLQRSLSRLVPGRSSAVAGFRALDDVTFEVERGEFFGIVGPNGSGKSTLTQVLSGITTPTAGEARIWGRILPLLEVGAGFHDELTGRENVFLLGAILGLGGRQIEESMKKIIAFAGTGVGRHIDSPMKRYSSGMKARLSFATAICFPADIYAFDEVLAVVDDDFRAQCATELASLHAAGKTILFMSHDLDLVVEMCSSGMWIEDGCVRATGAVADVAAAYRAGSSHAVPAPA